MTDLADKSLRLWMVDTHAYYWVAARNMVEALVLVRAEAEKLGALTEFDEEDGCEILELSERVASKRRYQPGDGDPNQEETDMWTAFQRMTEPTCFACSEWP